MKLKHIVGIVIIGFCLLWIYFWITGVVMRPPVSNPAAQHQASEKAAQDGLLDVSGPPIIH